MNYSSHLTSNNYNSSNQYRRPDCVNIFDKHKEYIIDIGLASEQRTGEVNAIINDAKSKSMSIILGYFNDVSGSKPLDELENLGFNNAWWQRGCGYGATIHKPFPFCIDNIFTEV